MMNDRSRRWQVLWMLAGALIFGGVLGCAGMYVVSRMSSAAYTDRFVRFVAHGPGKAHGEYTITLSPDDVAGFPQEIILFVEGDVDGSLSEAALVITQYDGYEDPIIVNIAGDQWSIIFSTTAGTWYLRDTDHDGYTEVMRAPDGTTYYLVDGTWTVGRFKSDQYELIDGRWHLTGKE